MYKCSECINKTFSTTVVTFDLQFQLYISLGGKTPYSLVSIGIWFYFQVGFILKEMLYVLRVKN